MGKYFNPPGDVPKVGRLLAKGNYDQTVEQLREGEVLIGLFYAPQPFLAAALIDSREEWDRQSRPGSLADYYAVSRAGADRGFNESQHHWGEKAIEEVAEYMFGSLENVEPGQVVGQNLPDSQASPPVVFSVSGYFRYPVGQPADEKSLEVRTPKLLVTLKLQSPGLVDRESLNLFVTQAPGWGHHMPGGPHEACLEMSLKKTKELVDLLLNELKRRERIITLQQKGTA